MNLRNTLNRFMRAVLEEADRNPAFETALHEALTGEPPRGREPKPTKEHDAPRVADSRAGEQKRGKNRRAAAILDPLQVVRSGEAELRGKLSQLNIEQLKDIVAEYGMDPGRLVIKWATPERVIDRIVELSVARAQKGDAFRRPADDAASDDTGDAAKPTSS